MRISRKELQEKRDQQQPDVHAVDVRIRRDHNLVVPEPVESVLDVQRGLEQVKLLVLVDHLLRQPVRVERFALQREHRLRLHVARGGQRTGGGVAFDDEERAFLRPLVAVAEVQAAVAEFPVVQRGLLRALPREVADAGEFLPLALAFLQLRLQRLGGLLVLVQIPVERLLHELAHKILQTRAVRSDGRGPELGLRLPLEHRLHHAHRDRRIDRLADVRRVVVLLEEVAYRVGQRLAKRREVRAPPRRVLPVDERNVFLAIVPAVRERHLDVVALG